MTWWKIILGAYYPTTGMLIQHFWSRSHNSSRLEILTSFLKDWRICTIASFFLTPILIMTIVKWYAAAWINRASRVLSTISTYHDRGRYQWVIKVSNYVGHCYDLCSNWIFSCLFANYSTHLDFHAELNRYHRQDAAWLWGREQDLSCCKCFVWIPPILKFGCGLLLEQWGSWHQQLFLLSGSCYIVSLIV